MKIKMLKTTKGSPDGFTVRSYAAGKEYIMSGGPANDLAKVFVEQMEVAVEVKPKVIEIKVPEKELEIQTPEQVKIETPEKVVIKKEKPKVKSKPVRSTRRRKE